MTEVRTMRGLATLRCAVLLVCAVLLAAACTSASDDGRATHGLTARLVLDTTSVRAGHAIPGHLVLSNDTGSAIPYCNGVAIVGLAKPGLRFDPIEPAVGCVANGRGPTIPTGTSRWRIVVQTRYQACSESGPATASFPRCGTGSVIPPLPAGRYHTVVVWHVADTVHAVAKSTSVELTR